MTIPGDPRLPGLVEALERHRTDDAIEFGHRRAMLELAKTPAPLSAEQYEPGHFTASGLVVSSTTGHVLLIRHPTLGRWLQPGGHVDPTDGSVLDAAIREVHEETGFTPAFDPTPIDVDVHPIPARGSRPGHGHYDVRFIGTIDGTPPIAGGEAIIGAWCDHAETLRRVTDLGLERLLAKAAALGRLR